MSRASRSVSTFGPRRGLRWNSSKRAQAEERVADDQERPSLAEPPRGRGQRSTPGSRSPPEHGRRVLAEVGCVMLPLASRFRFITQLAWGAGPVTATGSPRDDLHRRVRSLLDLFIVNIAFPDIRATSPARPRAACRGCSTGTRSCSPRCWCRRGALVDLYGRPRAFLVGLGLLCSPRRLCGARAVRRLPHRRARLQGAGAAFILTRARSGWFSPASRRARRRRGHGVGRGRCGRWPPPGPRSAALWSRAGTGCSSSTFRSGSSSLRYAAPLTFARVARPGGPRRCPTAPAPRAHGRDRLVDPSSW